MSKSFPAFLLSSALSLAFASVAFAQVSPAPAADPAPAPSGASAPKSPLSGGVPKIDGSWKMSIPAANQSFTFELIQKDSALTGTFHGPRGDAPITGSVTPDNKVTFTAKGKIGTSEFMGTVDGETMKGTANIPRLGKTDWTATK